jgi:hypothetical protein
MTTSNGSDALTRICARLDRAEEHRKAIQAQKGRIEERGGGLRVEPNADQSVLDVFWQFPAHEWALVVSDAFHQFRAALDNLVYALHVAHSGSPHAGAAHKIAFPIYTIPEEFDERGVKNIAGVHPDARAFIRRAQPYNRRDRPEFHPLAVLAEFNNRDKHREPHLAMVVLDTLTMTNVDNWPIARTWVSNAPIAEDGAFLARIEFVNPMQRGMKMEFEPFGRVGLHYTWREGRGDTAIDRTVVTPLDSTLKGIHNRACRVVAVLAPFL